MKIKKREKKKKDSARRSNERIEKKNHFARNWTKSVFVYHALRAPEDLFLLSFVCSVCSIWTFVISSFICVTGEYFIKHAIREHAKAINRRFVNNHEQKKGKTSTVINTIKILNHFERFGANWKQWLWIVQRWGVFSSGRRFSVIQSKYLTEKEKMIEKRKEFRLTSQSVSQTASRPVVASHLAQWRGRERIDLRYFSFYLLFS